jgi:hypothetical protein
MRSLELARRQWPDEGYGLPLFSFEVRVRKNIQKFNKKESPPITAAMK